MIYEYPDADQPLRQGDIFRALPRIDISLTEMLVISEAEALDVQTTWKALLATGTEDVTIAVNAKPVYGIIITQDCDVLRSDRITLCEILPIEQVIGQQLGQSVKKIADNLVGYNKKNLKWFYLPPDAQAGFTARMAADFTVTFTSPRIDLDQLRELRVARLNPEADEHFRERLSEFFRRYPVDEWYPLSAEEFAAYKATHPEAEPRAWQTPPAPTPPSPATESPQAPQPD